MQRKTKPCKALNRAPVKNSILLRHIQRTVAEVVTPAWVSKPPRDVGLPKAGTLKADHWRILFEIHVPFAMLSLWKTQSPLASEDAENMAAVLKTSMHLTCAAIWMTKRNLTAECREHFLHHLTQHIEGLKENFPGYMYPGHHLAFHLYDFMKEFSGVRHWWCFPFENLIGKLQRTPINHKPGVCMNYYNQISTQALSIRRTRAYDARVFQQKFFLSTVAYATGLPAALALLP